MTLNSLLQSVWVALGSLSLVAATYFGAVSQDSAEIEFTLARIFFGAAVLLGGSYLMFQIFCVDTSWKIRILIGIFSGALLGGALFSGPWYFEKREIQLTTKLYPDNLSPVLPSACANTPVGAFTVIWGSNASWSSMMPHDIVSMGGEVMLTVDKDGDKLVVTKLKILDDRGDAVAVANGEGTFWIKQGARRSRPNRSSLAVFDYADNEVLRLVFANPSTLIMTGIFRKPGIPNIVMTQDKTMIGTNTLSGNCFGNNGTDIAVN